MTEFDKMRAGWERQDETNTLTPAVDADTLEVYRKRAEALVAAAFTDNSEIYIAVKHPTGDDFLTLQIVSPKTMFTIANELHGTLHALAEAYGGKDASAVVPDTTTKH